MTDYRNPPPGVFVHRTRIWFDELDALGVLHHSRFVYHLERAQKAMFTHILGVDTLDPTVAPDIYHLVRNLELNYVAPVEGERAILIAVKVVKVRAAGMTAAFAFRSDDGVILHCHGTRTVCRMDVGTKAPVEWTPLFRQKYESWVEAGSSSPVIP